MQFVLRKGIVMDTNPPRVHEQAVKLASGSGRVQRANRRWVAGLAAVLAGVLWCAAVLIHASRPTGCIGTGCMTGGLRPFGVAEGVMGLAALLLINPALVTLSVMVRDIEPADVLSRVGLLVGGAGVGLLSAAGLAQASLEDFTWMPVIVIPGLLSSVAGLCLFILALWRARVLPRWVPSMLLCSTLLVLVGNEQTDLVLFWLPLGFGWVIAGGALARCPHDGPRA